MRKTTQFSTRALTSRKFRNRRRKIRSTKIAPKVSSYPTNYFLVVTLGMGTSDQIAVGSPTHKRTASLHHADKSDTVVVYDSKWKSKAQVDPSICPPRLQTTKERLFEPASNVERKAEEGCMKKIKIERTAKLDTEDRRGRNYNILNGSQYEPEIWVKSMGPQASGFQLG